MDFLMYDSESVSKLADMFNFAILSFFSESNADYVANVLKNSDDAGIIGNKNNECENAVTGVESGRNTKNDVNNSCNANNEKTYFDRYLVYYPLYGSENFENYYYNKNLYDTENLLNNEVVRGIAQNKDNSVFDKAYIANNAVKEKNVNNLVDKYYLRGDENVNDCFSTLNSVFKNAESAFYGVNEVYNNEYNNGKMFSEYENNESRDFVDIPYSVKTEYADNNLKYGGNEVHNVKTKSVLFNPWEYFYGDAYESNINGEQNDYQNNYSESNILGLNSKNEYSVDNGSSVFFGNNYNFEKNGGYTYSDYIQSGMDSFFNNSFESNCSKIKSDFDGSSYKNYVYDGILFNPYKELYDNKGLKSYENLFSDIEAYERRGYEAYNKIYNEAYNKAYNNADIYGYDVESGNVPDNIVQNVFGENIGAGNRAYNDEASFVNMLVREYEAASANGGDMGVTDLSTVQKISDEIRNYNNSGGNVNISVGGVTQNISGNADAQDVMQIFTESLRRGINACGSRYMEENR